VSEILEGALAATTMRSETATSRAEAENRFLHEVVSTVASSLELDKVLTAVVRLLSDASAVHACFVYLLHDDRLTLRAASEPYGRLIGKVVLERGEGLAWWALEHREPGFIRDKALADPRFKYVPELEEEQFQSLVSVPLLARDGAAIGVITLHTEAPREFNEDEAELLMTSASLVAGAIDNARLYDETRRRVRQLEDLTDLGEAIARAATLEELVTAVTCRTAAFLAARACHLYLVDPTTSELRLRASWPHDAPAPTGISLPDLARRPTDGAVEPLVADDEVLGVLSVEGSRHADLARAVASQTAVALKKIELIERLTDRTLIRDFLDDLTRGQPAEHRAARLGIDLESPHLVVAGSTENDEVEHRLTALAPGALVDRRDETLLALLPVPLSGEAALVAALKKLTMPLGISSSCVGAAALATGIEEAGHALIGSSLLHEEAIPTAYDELGPYKYLLRISLEEGLRDHQRDAVARVADYDRVRGTSLLGTLEEFLRRRGNMSATSEALFVHPNTLRQRLRRIEQLSGLDLRSDDWLMIEIAVKMMRLEQALGTVSPPSVRE
jgi:GAF domain-containing protein